MATVEIWILSIFSILFAVFGGYFVITYIFPMVKDMVDSTIKDPKITNGIMGLLNLLVILFVVTTLVSNLVVIGNRYVSYITVINPALDIFNNLIPYLKYLLVGIFVIVIARIFKNKS